MYWLVLLEADRRDDVPVDMANIGKLLTALADPSPGALHSDDRYALQVEVEAPGASAAIVAAIHQWEEALRELNLPRWELVRVEALTRDEFEQEVIVYDGESPFVPLVADAGPGRGVEDQLLRRAFHDPLTDLASQSLFRDYLEHALGHPKGADERCALVLLDVDGFAGVNERLGPRVGDTVLVSIAQRVASAAGPVSKVGRMGGDQFAVQLQVVSSEEAWAATHRIVDAVAAPMLVQAAELHLTVSAGIAVEEGGDTAGDLLRRATLAVRTAQERGGGRYELYTPDMEGADIGRLEAEREAMTAPDADSYLALLERVSRAVAECAKLEDAGSVVLRHVCDDAGFPVGRLFLRADDGSGDPVPAGTWIVGGHERFAPLQKPAGRCPLSVGQGVARVAFTSGAPACIPDVAADPDGAVHRDVVAAGLRGAVAVPVMVDARTVAVVEFFAEQALESCDALLQVLATVGTQLGVLARRQGADTARARAEARLRVLLENSGVHVKVLGPDGRLREQYPVTWPEDSALGLNAVDFVHPDDLAVAVRSWADALESPGPHPPFECRVRLPDGSWRWAEVTTNNMLDDPAVAGIVAFGRDAEDRKRSEQQLRRCESRLREAQALGRLGTWYADLLTGRVEWSDELYRIFGLDPGAAAPDIDNLLAMAHPDDRPVLDEQRRMLWTGAGQACTFRIVGPDGSIRWISAQSSAVRDGTGHVVALQGTFQDVTERKELERIVRESQQRLHEVEALAGVGSWYTDAATGSITWSPELYAILGLDQAAVMASPENLRAAIHPDDRPAADVHALCQRRLATATDFECRIVRPGGEIRWVRIRSSATRNDAGAIVAYHGVVWDVTASRRGDQSVRA